MMQIIIGKISSIFRLIFNWEYLANTSAQAPKDKVIEPVLTAPLIEITKPITTTDSENLRIWSKVKLSFIILLTQADYSTTSL